MQYINDNLKVEGQITQNDGKNVLDTSNVTAYNPTLQFGATTTIAKVGNTNITVAVPSVTDSDSKVTQTHLTTNTNKSILLATNNTTGTVTSGVYKNSAVTVNSSTGKITSKGYVVTGSTDKYVLLGNGTTQLEHNTRNHEALFIQDVNVADDFINSYYEKFAEGNDEIDTFIIAPFGSSGSGVNETFDFSLITYNVQSKLNKNVSKKRFHIYVEYTTFRVWLNGCISNADFLAAGCPHKIECYYDDRVGAWFVDDCGVMYAKNGEFFNSDMLKEYLLKHLGK